MRVTLHAIRQAARVAELLAAGRTNREIGEDLHVSAARVSQIRQRIPELRPYLNVTPPSERLQGHREQLVSLRREALLLAREISRDLRTLDEELDAARTDHILGLRTVA